MALAAVYIILGTYVVSDSESQETIEVPVCASVIQALGLLLTAWRIYIRLKIHRFWWEDAWATILLFTGLLWMIAQCTFLLSSELSGIDGCNCRTTHN